MSTQAVTAVKAHTIGSTAAKAILLVLADYADSEWSSFASQKRLAAEAEVGERTVRRILSDLENVGVVKRERRNRSDGTRTSDRITIVEEQLNLLPHTKTGTHAKPATVSHELAVVEPTQEKSRNYVWDAFSDLFGEPPNQPLKLRRGRNVRNVAEALGPDSKFSSDSYEEVVRRAQTWPLHFPDATLTEEALGKHWVTLGRPPLRATRTQVQQLEKQVDQRKRLELAAEIDRQEAIGSGQ